MTHRITFLHPADKESLERLYEKSLRANPQGFIQDISFHGNIYDLFLRYQDNGGIVRVLKDEDKLIGMGGLCLLDEGAAELCKLHLDREYQGQGLGKFLLNALLDEGKKAGLKQVDLHVTVTQEAAIGLYLKSGFEAWQQKECVISVNGKEEIFDTVFMRKIL